MCGKEALMSTIEAPDAPSAGMELLSLEDAAAFLGPSFSSP